MQPEREGNCEGSPGVDADHCLSVVGSNETAAPMLVAACQACQQSSLRYFSTSKTLIIPEKCKLEAQREVFAICGCGVCWFNVQVLD